MCFNKSMHYCLLSLALYLTTSLVNASEIQAFRLLGYDGTLALNYLKEDNFSGIVNGASEDRELTGFQQELNLLFYSFIYHPNFIRFDFGGGIITKQDKTETLKVDNTNTQTVEPTLNTDTASIDYHLKFLFFEKKDYPFSLFYKKQHPNLRTTVINGQSIENTEYGLDLTWKAPIEFRLFSNHFETQGSGFLRRIDETRDSTRLSARKLLENAGRLDLTLRHSISSSKSGSTLIPVANTKNTIDSLEYIASHHFDDAGKYNLNMRVGYERQRDSFEFDRSNFSSVFDWKHSQKLKTNYLYSYDLLELANLKTTSQNARVGITYFTQTGLSASSNLTARHSKSIGSLTKSFSFNNNVSYSVPFTDGSFSVGGHLILSESDTETTLSEILAVERSVKLSNLELVLANNNIINTPSKPIKVTRVNDISVVYTEGIDYIIIQRGGVTSIKLGASSLILDDTGGVVRIEYFYAPGNSNKFLSTTRSVTSRLDFFEYFYVHGEYLDFDLDVKEGTVTNTEVTYRTDSKYGGGFDYALFDTVLIGASKTIEEIDENIVLSDTELDTVYLQYQLFSSTNLHLSRTTTLIDYTILQGGGADNDVDKITYSAVLTMHPNAATNVSLIYDQSTDVGTIEHRTSTQTRLRVNWRYRKIRFEATGTLHKEQNGDDLRETSSVFINLVRTF